MTFEEFSIDPRFMKLLKAQGIVEPTPVQEQAIPVALEGKDLLAIAQTGTGKTLAFALPSLTRLAGLPRTKNAMLVLAPTRELAIQVHAVIEPLAKSAGLNAVCVYGGAGMDKQATALRQGRTVVVATPGRLLDHFGRGNVRFDHLAILVLDEADRMLDMGFLPDIRRILDKLPKDRQTLFFSATFPQEIARLAADMQQSPQRIEVGTIMTPVDSVRQQIYTVSATSKISLLTKILRDPAVTSALVFIRTKHRTDRVAKALHREGFKAQAIHGDRSQNQRQHALDGFREGRYKILVATDVAARGLDIQGISHVINFDIPKTAEEYIHRIGRTARASAEGDAITFVCPEEFMDLKTLEKALGKNLPRAEWEGAVPVISLFTPESERPKVSRGSRRRHSLLRRR
ncbi:MAG TPA: DEAD/DEAH box helicase [Candidatus Hydrogenedentes bacterium]|nr:DEAD/DEAH box helicase [Candidatus Hydrogenedentota bacterium]HPC14995.1 DEAD/DEAH box helicase [Candidatus Hydrogenedentota bacterium]HRT19144.1 DEAD/DEAH box helicase [Candidatus Hydrogenedentota bacterium]HRT64073.1 DEAD/DEAH box helicase [Candidatus Hydrogenedentota bacterium]